MKESGQILLSSSADAGVVVALKGYTFFDAAAAEAATAALQSGGILFAPVFIAYLVPRLQPLLRDRNIRFESVFFEFSSNNCFFFTMFIICYPNSFGGNQGEVVKVEIIITQFHF